MELKQVLKNNEAWIADKLKSDSDYFKKLAKGQTPEILYIGCSDSRVTAEGLMGLEPGEVFVHRNVANLVPNNDLNSTAVITYAVSHLKVNKVVICGHYYCGGVKAAMTAADLGVINPWLSNIRDVYRLHQAELDAITDEEARYKRLVELNVQEQCINMIKLPDVQEAYLQGDLTIHGWVFDISTGGIIDLELDMKKVLEDILDAFRLA